MRFKLFFLLASLAPVALPAILPDTIGAWKRGDPGPAATPDTKVWLEYGLQDGETAPYSDGTKAVFHHCVALQRRDRFHGRF